MEVGAVAAMRYVPEGIKAAKLVLEYTKHTMLVGDQASAFAISMGLQGPTNLSSVESIEKWTKWKDNSCQPNFRKNVIPRDSCGPFHPNGPSIRRCLMDNELRPNEFGSVNVGLHSHDTISMAVIDQVSCWCVLLYFVLLVGFFRYKLFILSSLDWTDCRWNIN